MLFKYSVLDFSVLGGAIAISLYLKVVLSSDNDTNSKIMD